eukprot:1835944-Amphidinium_carterae.1
MSVAELHSCQELKQQSPNNESLLAPQQEWLRVVSFKWDCTIEKLSSITSREQHVCGSGTNFLYNCDRNHYNCELVVVLAISIQ